MSERAHSVIDSDNLVAAAELAGAVVLARLALPVLLTWVANRFGKRLSGLQARVERVDIDLTRPGLTVEGLQVDQQTDGAFYPLARIETVRVGSDWSTLLNGCLQAHVEIDRPRVEVDLKRLSTMHTVPAPSTQPQPAGALHANGTVIDPMGSPDPTIAERLVALQDRLRRLPPFNCTRVELHEGSFSVRGIPALDHGDLRVTTVNAVLENLSNDPGAAATMPTVLACSAELMKSGRLTIDAEAFPLIFPPQFDLDCRVEQLELTDFRALMAQLMAVDIEGGTAYLLAEAAAADGELRGYAKPIVDGLRVKALKGRGLKIRLKGWTVKLAARLLRNRATDRLGTRVDFSGPLDHPRVRMAAAVRRLLRNTFRPENVAIEDRIELARNGVRRDLGPAETAADPPSPSTTTARLQRRGGLGNFAALSKAAAVRWLEDNAMQHAAALAYCTAFSIAPLLLLATGVAGMMLGSSPAIQARIIRQIAASVGPQSAHLLQSMIAGVSHPGRGAMAAIISVVSILIGATGVLSSMKTALNQIWRTHEAGNLKEVVKRNAVFLGMILGIGFLLAVSLIISTAIAALGAYLGSITPALEFVMQTASFFVTLAIEVVLFAAIFKFLPNVEVRWHDVWIGAVVTALLFSLGKITLGYYLGRSAISSYYGAASSLMILLLWIYYSGLILYFGAEITAVAAALRVGPEEPVRKFARQSG